MKPHPHLLRLLKQAAATPESRYGEIKPYNPSLFQKAKDWHYQKTAPGMLGPNQSSYNAMLNIGSSPVAGAALGGGLGAASKAWSLARPVASAAANVAGAVVSPVANLATQGYAAVKNKFSPPPAPAAPAPSPAPAQPAGEGFDFQAMLPFLMAILPQLFGGGQQAAPTQMYAPPTSLDRLARRSPYA